MIERMGEARNASITVLVDNRADLLVQSTDTVKYYAEQPLLAEHGFAAVVDLPAEGVRILWDAGMTTVALLENMRRIKIDPASIGKIVLSHGHRDHTASITPLLQAMHLKPRARDWEPTATGEEMARYAQGRRVPLVVHPAAFRERWAIPTGAPRRGPVLPPSRTEWEAAGAEVVLEDQPHRLGEGCWTTGAVPRRSFETAGTPPAMAYRDGATFPRDYVDDDQAIILNVQDKGLVVLCGCAHAGVVNTIEHARAITGVERVWAVLGGWHLAKAQDDDIQRTVDAIKGYHPRLIAPSHCTGFRALCQFAAQMPEAFVQGVVGATYLF